MIILIGDESLICKDHGLGFPLGSNIINQNQTNDARVLLSKRMLFAYTNDSKYQVWVYLETDIERDDKRCEQEDCPFGIHTKNHILLNENHSVGTLVFLLFTLNPRITLNSSQFKGQRSKK